MKFANFTERHFKLLVGLLLILSPLGNVLVSFAGSMLSNWYHPDVLSPFFRSIPATEWLWLGLLPLAGVAVILPFRFGLNLAVPAVGVVFILSAYRFFNGDIEPMEAAFGKIFSLISLLGSALALFVVCAFRFRRLGDWLPGRLRRRV